MKLNADENAVINEIVKLNANENAVINEQQAKEALQNEIQIMKAEVQIASL